MSLQGFRVVEIYEPRDEAVGSGYLVTPRLVLTARHVVVAAIDSPEVDVPDGQLTTSFLTESAEGRTRCHVRLLSRTPRLPFSDAVVVWSHEKADVALLLVVDHAWFLQEHVGGLRWADLEGADPATCSAVGFPSAEARGAIRETWQILGTVAPLSQYKEGRWVVQIDGTIGVPLEGEDSAWAGISGAALFWGDLLIGLLVLDPSPKDPARMQLWATPAREFADDPQLVGWLRADGGGSSWVRAPTALARGVRQPVSVPLTAQGLNVELLDKVEYKRVRRILLGAPAAASLRSLYREAMHNSPAMQINLERLRNYAVLDYVAELRQLVDATPLFEFLVRFAAASDQPTREKLDGWIETTARRYFGLRELDELRELRAELHRTVLLVQLEPYPLGEGWRSMAWTYVGAEGALVAAPEDPWGRRELRELLSDQFAKFVDDFDAADGSMQLMVEFLVGIDMLDEELESLPVTIDNRSYELGTACPVVVRSLDRACDPTCVERWHVKWRQLQEHGAGYDPDMIGWIVGNEGLAEKPGVCPVCAALICPPGPDHAEVLRAALMAGTPVAVWHRAAHSRTSPRIALEKVLGVSGLLDLPETVMRHRINARDAETDPSHSGRGLVLLWDDPERLPQNFIWHEPALAGGA